MDLKVKSESGAEIIQLAFAIPILVLLFGLCAQFLIWASTAVQFANAAEYAAYHVDIDELCDAGIGSASSEAIIANEIAEGLVGIEAKNVQVSNVSLDLQPTSTQSGKGYAAKDSSGAAIDFFESESRGLLGFSASCTAPSIVEGLKIFSVGGTWQRDRLISKTAEVRYDLG